MLDSLIELRLYLKSCDFRTGAAKVTFAYCACIGKCPFYSWSRKMRALLPDHDVNYSVFAPPGQIICF